MRKYLNQINFKYAIVAITILAFTISCEESNIRDDIREITLKPTANTRLITEGDVITYTDSSKNVASRMWTFDGGSISNSDQEIVDVMYATEGEYLTEIEVTNTEGEVRNHSFSIEVFPPVTANFSTSANAAQLGSQIQFTNTSLNAASAFPEAELEDTLLWEFEGGVPATSSLENPTVAYPNVGVFNVKLTVFRNAPEFTDVIISEDFITIVDAEIISPDTIEFADLGQQIVITYPTAVSTIPDTQFTVSVDGTDAAFSLAIDAMDPNSYVLTFDEAIGAYQEVILNYAGSDLAVTGELLAPIISLSLENNLNLFENGDFEGITTAEYDVNNGFLGSGAGAISVDFVDGEGVNGSRASVWTATSATAGNKRTIFGDKDFDNVQYVRPVASGETYLVRARVKYTGTPPLETRLSIVNFTFNGNVQNCTVSGDLVEGEFVSVEGQFTTTGAIGPEAYALPNVTVGGPSVVTIDNFEVYKLD